MNTEAKSHRTRHKAKSQDFELTYYGPPSDPIPTNTYIVECVSCIENRGINKLFLNFQIVDVGEYCGMKVMKSYNFPRDGRIRFGSKYYADWVRFNGGPPSKPGVKMDPDRVFKGHFFLVKVVRKYLRHPETKEEMESEEAAYGYVEEIIKRMD